MTYTTCYFGVVEGAGAPPATAATMHQSPNGGAAIVVPPSGLPIEEPGGEKGGEDVWVGGWEGE